MDEATVRTHDGFYLRMGLGGGTGRITSKASNTEAVYSGGGVAVDLLMGGTIANTVAIGGGFVTMAISAPDVELTQGGETVSLDGDGDISMSTLGPLVDVFFGPQSGAHVGFMLGLATIDFEQTADASNGWGMVLFGGYDFWVSNQWALGVNARYNYIRQDRDAVITDDLVFDDLRLQDTAHTFCLLFSALYH